jgi:hypothetical protein
MPPTSSGSAKGRYRNSRTSHARASFQSRMTLCGEICKFSAVYSTLNPPKKTELDDARFSCVHACEVVECLIQRQNLGALL